MAVDYDLVILGGTLEGRRAAIKAARYGARVALIEVPRLFEANQRQRFVLQCLQQLGQGLQRQKVGQWFGFEGAGGGLDWQAVLAWSAIAAETQSVGLSAEVLGRQGVDVVMAVPERLSRDRGRNFARDLVVTTAGRRFRSRAVLAAFGLSSDALEPLMCAESLPHSAMVLGGNTRAIEWAQALSGVGVAVTLKASQVLPGWDERLQGLVRSQLIAKGIQLIEPHDTQVSSQLVNAQLKDAQLKNAQSKVECTLPLDTESPALSLPQFVDGSEDASANYLRVNHRLQSAHPRVFACGSLLGGAVDDGLAEYEAEIAVKNALFLPRTRVESTALAQGSHSFAKVGLSELKAQQRYGVSAICVLAASCANSADMSGPVPLPQYCKIVCCYKQIVGIHLFGEMSLDVAQSLTGMLGRSIHEISSVVFPSQGLPAVVRAAARKSAVCSQWQIGHWQRDWAENWFNWRRSS